MLDRRLRMAGGWARVSSLLAGILVLILGSPNLSGTFGFEPLPPKGLLTWAVALSSVMMLTISAASFYLHKYIKGED